jgi:RimJ/RimL family protein N-acetyltransferase
MRVHPRSFAMADGRPFVVRSARQGEAGAVFDHYLCIRTEEPDVNVEEADEWGVTTDAVRRLIDWLDRASNGFLLVAEVEGRIAGVLSLEGGRFRKVHHVGEMGVSVARRWRRQGIARRMLETALDAARASGELARLSLRVFASNAAARRLYESAGFAVEGRRPGYLRIQGREEDLILMGRALR